MTDIIDSGYESIDANNIIPSFLKWLFNGTLNLTNNGSIGGIGFIILVGIISFFVFKGFRYEKALVVSGIITWFVGLLIFKIGWISQGVFVLVCIYGVVGIYYLFKESSAEEA